MIRKVRQRHKIIWLILAILLLLILASSIAFRHSEPLNEKIPSKKLTVGKLS